MLPYSLYVRWSDFKGGFHESWRLDWRVGTEHTSASRNGVTTTYGYDTLNRVSGHGYTAQNGVYVYGRDNTGTLASDSELSGRSVIWNFDGINRLTSESISEADGTNYTASTGWTR